MPSDALPSRIAAHPLGSSSETRTVSRQASRIGIPLVNELVIGLDDKNKFNASRPRNDAQFLQYVTNPTVPALSAPSGGLPFTDGVRGDASTFRAAFPYFNYPIPGSFN